MEQQMNQYEQVLMKLKKRFLLFQKTTFSVLGLTAKDNHIRNHMVYLERMGMNSYLSITNGSVRSLLVNWNWLVLQFDPTVRNGMDEPKNSIMHMLGVRYIVTEVFRIENICRNGYEVISRVLREKNAH
ncbi:hypothetical protein LMF32_02175 [Desemzia sp. C1]|uniref:hypothetical protein n=1 Tax=Desemzia sp. C1 TaxID=2892016 RepID=UPI001E55EB1E|nr:hypothetical protein [Desemzia sp. C1]MCI3027939.1 hypothetical protein [Desemzia sp. C1]